MVLPEEEETQEQLYWKEVHPFVGIVASTVILLPVVLPEIVAVPLPSLLRILKIVQLNELKSEARDLAIDMAVALPVDVRIAADWDVAPTIAEALS